MDTVFLQRPAGSEETGSQIFTKFGNETIYFLKDPSAPLIEPDPPGLLNSVLVIDGGWSNTNGTYNYVTEFDGKPYYYNDNFGSFIIWLESQWEIYDFSKSFLPIYYSTENTPYPWNVITWLVNNINDLPVPIVTKIL